MPSPLPDLAAAYRTLDIAIGSDPAAVRAAWHTLVKVWHPDRHANDPELLAHAERKLREVNAAYEAIRAAGFPTATAPPTAPRPPTAPTPPTPPTPPLAPAPPTSPLAPPPGGSRWWLAAIAVGAAVAIAGVVVVTAGRDADPVRQAQPRPPRPTVHVTTSTTESTSSASSESSESSESSFESLSIHSTSGSAVVLGHPAPTLAPAPAPDGPTFTLGSTEAEVRAAQGEPTQITQVIDTQWSYGFSTVEFADNGTVVGWWSLDVPLRVRLDPHDPARAAAARARGTIHHGSDRDEVLGIEGVPTQIAHVINTTWSYGFSSIDFDDAGKVIEWHLADRDLHVASE